MRNDDNRGSESRTRGDAQQIGISQGVTKDALVRGSARGEHGSDHAAEDHARKPNIPHDPLLKGGSR